MSSETPIEDELRKTDPFAIAVVGVACFLAAGIVLISSGLLVDGLFVVSIAVLIGLGVILVMGVPAVTFSTARRSSKAARTTSSRGKHRD